MDLTPEHARVIGCLIEKAETTPDSYPLTSNALRNACNQSTNRDPVVDYSERQVDAIVLELREMKLARTVTGSGHRVGKHKHVVDEALGLDGAELAVLTSLLLRGPQTRNEIATRTERYANGPGGDRDAVDAAIDRLAARSEPLAVRLPRRPGEREPRIDQCWAATHGGSVTEPPVSPSAPTAAPVPTPVPAVAAAMAPAPAPAHAPAPGTGSGPARRVAIIAHAAGYVGPDLAVLMAEAGHDLVLGTPVDGLVERCEAAGAAVISLGRDELGRDHEPGHAAALVAAAQSGFGRIDAAMTFTGSILGGWFLKEASTEQLDALTKGLINAPFEFLHAVVPAMVDGGGGQVLVLTSATAARPTPRAPLYSALRAGADHLIRNVAVEVAPHGVQVNGIGTNYMDFPQYWDAVGGESPERRAKIEAQVPMARMGQLDELAQLCKVFLDGTMGFATGQTIQFDGGWSV